ncbi:hypothetical protein ACH0B5_05775 [Ureibacillus sp. 179-F W5.1 NHS]|nr:hypothetical protein [Lysinibacillus halotolerans]
MRDEKINEEKMDEESLMDLIDKMASQPGTVRKLTEEEIKKLSKQNNPFL